MYTKYIKRFLDFCISVFALILLLPIIGIIAILIRKNFGKPIIFCQERPGKNEEIFKLYKFRTMSAERDSSGNLLSDEKRLTKFGKVIRATSLDELPELFNILIGDMSLVGPRPLLVEYLPLYSDDERHRHDVRPGLTGLAQINGRNAISWNEKFEYDLWYVAHVTFINDLKILISTIKKVFMQDGINGLSSATVEPFIGHEYSEHKGR